MLIVIWLIKFYSVSCTRNLIEEGRVHFRWEGGKLMGWGRIRIGPLFEGGEAIHTVHPPLSCLGVLTNFKNSPKKGETWTVCRFTKGLSEKEGGFIPQCTLCYLRQVAIVTICSKRRS